MEHINRNANTKKRQSSFFGHMRREKMADDNAGKVCGKRDKQKTAREDSIQPFFSSWHGKMSTHKPIYLC